MDWRLRKDIDGDTPSEATVAAAADVARAVAIELELLAPSHIEAELLLVNLVAGLQRVVTHPGSGDRNFLRDVRGKAPRLLSDAQRRRVMTLAWRYRFQLPPGLRPAENPEKTPDPKVN